MRIGIALGGGGARGLAHLPILQVFDDLGLRPHRIAGTSIGAIAGAAYAAGASAAELIQAADRLINAERIQLASWFDDDERPRHWLQLLSLGWGSNGLLNADRFLELLQQQWGISTFDALRIPLTVVATDYWAREEVVLQEGDVIAALAASMAVPGIFPPRQMGDRWLVDGGAVNPVPFDLLLDDCDLTIAVDIMGHRPGDHHAAPDLLECIFGSSQIMQRSIIQHKLELRRPDIYLAPEIHSVRVLEFNKAEQIYAESETACEQLRTALKALL